MQSTGLTTALRLTGFLTVTVGVVAGVLMLFSRYGSVPGGLLLLGAAVIVGMLFHAIAAGLELLVAIEENSRVTRTYFEQRLQRADDSQPKRSTGTHPLVRARRD